jgi:hypothetical protein
MENVRIIDNLADSGLVPPEIKPIFHQPARFSYHIINQPTPWSLVLLEKPPVA